MKFDLIYLEKEKNIKLKERGELNALVIVECWHLNQNKGRLLKSSYHHLLHAGINYKIIEVVQLLQPHPLIIN